MNEHAELQSNRASALDSDAESPTQDQAERSQCRKDGDDAALLNPLELEQADDAADSQECFTESSHPGLRASPNRKPGRTRTATARRVRMVALIHEDEQADLEILSEHWDVPVSTLCWAVLHDWLQVHRQRVAEFGLVKAQWMALIELAMRDPELKAWLQRQISDCVETSAA